MGKVTFNFQKLTIYHGIISMVDVSQIDEEHPDCFRLSLATRVHSFGIIKHRFREYSDEKREGLVKRDHN